MEANQPIVKRILNFNKATVQAGHKSDR